MWAALTFQGGHTATVVALGVLPLGLAAGALGAFLLLRGRALIGDVVAHAALPGFALGFLAAVALGLPPKSIVALGLGATLTALVTLLSIRQLEATPKLRPDAAMGVMLAAAYGLGIVLLSIVQVLPVGGQAGLTSYLLGSTAGMLVSEAWLNAGAAAIILLVLASLKAPLTSLVFDPEHARLKGLPVDLLDGIALALVLLLAIVALPSVGAILFVALLVIPAATARLWVERVGPMAALAAVIGATGAHVGVALSASLTRLPTGPAIVLTLAALFVLSVIVAPRRGLIARAGLGRARQAELAVELARARGTAP